MDDIFYKNLKKQYVRRGEKPKTDEEREKGEKPKQSPVVLDSNSDDDDDVSASSDLDVLSAPSDTGSDTSTRRSKRGRGRPPTTGQYVGLAKAKAALNAEKREALKIRAEEEMAEASRNVAPIPAAPAKPGAMSVMDVDNQLLSVITSAARERVTMVKTVAIKSTNLKGTFVRVLKDCAADLERALTAIDQRSDSEEVQKLKEANARLETEINVLRDEVAELRDILFNRPVETPKAPTPAPPPSVPTEEIVRRVLTEVGSLMDRKLETLSDSRTASRAQAQAVPIEDILKSVMSEVGSVMDRKLEQLKDGLVSSLQAEASIVNTGRGMHTASATQLSSEIPPIAPMPEIEPEPEPPRLIESPVSASPPAPTRAPAPAPKRAPAPDGWTKVQSKTQKKKEINKEQKKRAAKKKRGPRKKKLRTPRTTAVVIALQPGAAEKGVTYAAVLAEARNKINLPSIGIDFPLRYRRTATGARSLEIPGSTSGEKADALAAKLREALDQNHIRVTRPTKCAEMRISGLDESVTVEELTLAISRAGSCPKDLIKMGEIARHNNRLGTVWARCPIAAAKKIAEAGRLLVGWVAARVQILEKRPLRCFRCLEIGHTKWNCSSSNDRSEHCYRCGKPDHKASQCTETPHCIVCSDAGRPAGHRLGAQACTDPRQKRRRNAANNSDGKANKNKGTKPPVSTERPATKKGRRAEVTTRPKEKVVATTKT